MLEEISTISTKQNKTSNLFGYGFIYLAFYWYWGYTVPLVIFMFSNIIICSSCDMKDVSNGFSGLEKSLIDESTRHSYCCYIGKMLIIPSRRGVWSIW